MLLDYKDFKSLLKKKPAVFKTLTGFLKVN
jgi:hypothetical protein